LCTKFTWTPKFLSSELFYLHGQEILQSEFIHRSGKLLSSAVPGGPPQSGSRRISLGKGQDPLPGQNVKSWTILQIVGIDNPPVPKTDTQETEYLDKAIFS
jgi:hypothetical protein